MSPEANGTHRIYQDGSKYHLPKDAPEHERLEWQAESLVALMNNRPVHAPISQPKRILDIGCGTGSMTNLLATTYPTAQVIGIDLAPVPSIREKRENIEYVQGDIRELIGVDPRFELESFDYIFQRFLMFGLTKWPEHTASIATLLRPGGWLEFHEPNAQMFSAQRKPLSDSMLWYQQFKPDLTAMGFDVEIGDHLLGIFSSTPALHNVRESQHSFFPGVTEATPELHGIQKQLSGLFTVVTAKVSSAMRSEEEVEASLRDIRSTWEKGFKEGDHFTVHAVIAQKRSAQ